MSIDHRGLAVLGYSTVVVGIAFGVFGLVQVGSILISIGVVGVSLSRRPMSRVERYLPLALAVALFALAIALPSGR